MSFDQRDMIVINDFVYSLTSIKITSKKTKKKNRRDIVERDVAYVQKFFELFESFVRINNSEKKISKK